MQKRMKGKARAKNSEQRCEQKSTDQESEDSDSQAVPPTCEIMNKLPALSEPFLQMENEQTPILPTFLGCQPGKICPVV